MIRRITSFELERIGDELCVVIRIDGQRHRCIVGQLDDDTLELAGRSISNALINRWLPDEGKAGA